MAAPYSHLLFTIRFRKVFSPLTRVLHAPGKYMPLQVKDLVVRQIPPGKDWQRFEEDLIHAGIALPLYHRAAWVNYQKTVKHTLMTVSAADGQSLGAVAIQRYASRTLPGHHHLRVHRFGESLREELWQPVLAELARLARQDRSILRLTVNLFSRGKRDQLGTTFEQEGFRRSESPQSYRHTLVLDLSPSVENVLSQLDKKARRDLRECEKAGLYLAALTTEEYAGRLNALETEAMNRSGGSFQMQHWPAILQLSHKHPELSRVIGLFPSRDRTRPEDMVAFGWGCMHGTHGEYRSAGTARLPGNKLTLSTPIVWDLVLWSKTEGASWFDLGGVTLSTDMGNDSLSSISSYKRRFSTSVAEVGDDWILEPHRTRTIAADLLGKGAQGLGKLIAAVRSSRDLHAE